MQVSKHYCHYVSKLDQDNPHKVYHDSQYGFQIKDDNELFGRLVLEINQAGLSWDIILKKQANFRKAYAHFEIKKIAAFDEKEIERLKNDAGIVRNRLKIKAAIYNAQQILKLQNKYGSFKNWLDQHHPLELDKWVKLFRKTFKFTGPEICNEFLMSTGYLRGAHLESCAVFDQIKKSKPPWLKKD